MAALTLCFILSLASVWAVAPPPWAYHGFDSFPALWFGANATGLDNYDQLALISKHAIAGYGWQQATVLADYRHIENNLAQAASHLRTYLDDHQNDQTRVFVYRHMQMAWSGFDVQRIVSVDAAYDGMVVHDSKTGVKCTQGVPGGGRSPLYSWPNSSAGDFWVDEVVGELLSERDSIDAVFFDETDWSYCGYNWKNDNCPNIEDSFLVQYANASLSVLHGTALKLNSVGIIPIFSSMNFFASAWAQLNTSKYKCLVFHDAYVAALHDVQYIRFYEFWMGSGADFDAAMITNALLETAMGLPLIVRTQASNKTCSKGSDDATDLTYSIAAFLLIQSPYTYYGASSGWYDADWCWHSAYDRKYGAPLGPAVRTGPHSWYRNFTLVDVSVDTASATGIIHDRG